MSSRAVLCMFLQGNHNERPPLSLEQRSLLPWVDRWTPASGRKVWVKALRVDGTQEITDAREWIETCHDEKRWPAGTVFELVTEESS